MQTSEIYEELSKRKSSTALLSQFNDLKVKASNEGSYLYYFLSIIKISDIYLDLNEVDKAISTLNEVVNDQALLNLKNEHISILERLVYLYIQKGSFKLAYKYIIIKRSLIDENDLNALNRTFLELAYVHTKLNNLTDAIASYNAIIDAPYNDEFLSYAYSNLSRIYIDQHLISDAREALRNTITYTIDTEGKKYIVYLNAKLAILEGDFNLAKDLFESLFNEDKLSKDYISIANEYLTFLLDREDLPSAKRIFCLIDKNINLVADAETLKDYYVNKIKLEASILNSHDIKSSINSLLTTLSDIKDNENISSSNEVNNEINDEVNASLQAIVSKLEGINSIDYSSTKNVREFLISYLSNLEKVIGLNHFYVVDLNKDTKPAFIPVNSDLLDVYDYTNKRLYERTLSINRIDNTLIEQVIKTNNKVIVHPHTDNSNYVSFINGEKLSNDENINHFIAYPIIRDNELKFIICISSKFFDFDTVENSIITEIAVKRFSDCFINCLNKQLLDFNNSVIDLIQNKNLSIIHYNSLVYVNKELSNLLGINKDSKFNYIEKNTFLNLIDRIDYFDLFEGNKTQFDINYSIKTKNGFIKATESVSKVNYLDNNIYFSIINLKVDNSTNNEVDLDSFINNINLNNKYKCVMFESNFERSNVYEFIKRRYGKDCCNVTSNSYLVLLDTNDLLDKFSVLSTKFAIINYPSDIKDMNTLIDCLFYMFEQNETLFTQNIFINYLINKNNHDTLELNLNKSYLKSYINNSNNYLYLDIPGIVDSTKLRSVLNKQDKLSYDNKVVSLLDSTDIDIYFLPLVSSMVGSLFDTGLVLSNFNIIVDEYNEEYLKDILKAKDTGANIYLYYKDLKTISFESFNSIDPKGIILDLNLDTNKKKELSKYSLDLVFKD